MKMVGRIEEDWLIDKLSIIFFLPNDKKIEIQNPNLLIKDNFEAFISKFSLKKKKKSLVPSLQFYKNASMSP